MLWAACRLGSPLLIVCCWEPSGEEGLQGLEAPVVSFNKKGDAYDEVCCCRFRWAGRRAGLIFMLEILELNGATEGKI